MLKQTQKRLNLINRNNIAKYGTGAVLSTAIMSNAKALDVGTALTGNAASANIETAAIWILGISVTIYAARKVIGFFSR